MALNYNIPEQDATMVEEPAAMAYDVVSNKLPFNDSISATDAMRLKPTPQQSMQLEAFWNLMQTSDESVQYGLYILLNNKYSASKTDAARPVKSRTSFRDMKGILSRADVELKDLQDEYLKEKYGL
ncbi:MAG: hypothetical protein KBT33_04050 [Prevotellaceae bacterium]|nr:hypothetical protein [Candidatus Minthosoma equi]